MFQSFLSGEYQEWGKSKHQVIIVNNSTKALATKPYGTFSEQLDIKDDVIRKKDLEATASEDEPVDNLLT